MATEKFKDHDFKPDSLDLLDQATEIIDQYELQGYALSLRQLYYQLVSRAMVPNHDRQYKRLGDLITNAREAGLIDWDMIQDRNRTTKSNSHWETPRGVLLSAAHSFRMDKWAGQYYHVEVMVEKDALSGVLEPVCSRLDVPFTANKGYSSASALYRVAKRVEEKYQEEGKEPIVIYLGDHDPSGIDMTRDVSERLYLYANGIYVQVDRLALNMDQIKRWSPPPNPAKMTDSRFESYREQFGRTSWELDAIEPGTLAELVSDAISDYIEWDKFNELAKQEDAYRDEIKLLASKYGTNGK